MESFVFRRSGKSGLACEGEAVFKGTSRKNSHPSLERRWNTLTIVRLKSRRMVVAISFESDWDTETPHYEAQVVSNANDAIKYARGFDVTEWVNGFPPHLPERQNRLLVELETAYEAMCDDAEAKLVKPEIVE